MITWGDPRFLHSLWAFLPLAALLWLLDRRRERSLRLLADDAALARLAPERSRARTWARTGLWFLACALAVVSLARPQWGGRWQQVRRRGLDIVVVLDASNSMLATDLQPDRLQRAKLGLGDLLQRAAGDRVGLVAFAGASFLACPLTLDYAGFAMMLDDVGPATVPRGGTAIAQALETALGSFEYGEEGERAIVLISDGEDHEGRLDRAIAALRDKRVRVFAVGAGTLAGGTIPAAGGQGGSLLRDRSGSVIRTALREETLAKIAAATGGLYVRATAADFGLDRVFDEGIAKLRRDEHESRLVKEHVERFPWFLTAAALLLVCESLLGERRRRKEGEAR